MQFNLESNGQFQPQMVIYASDVQNNCPNETPPIKKHKKHKHKKHKKKKSTEPPDVGLQDSSFDESGSASLKLKIKLDKESVSPSTSGEKAEDKVMAAKLGDKFVLSLTVANSSPKTSSKKKKTKGKDSGTSSEEERWLDAIESGKLEEVDDELKKIKPKDPKLMTARQRAMFERKTDKDPSPGGEQLLALPSGYKEKVMTVEALQKAALKSQKRKQLADEKREKDKKKTMERLLKKQDSKSGKMSKSKSSQKIVPRVTYIHNTHGVTISLPVGMEFPLVPQSGKLPPLVQKCGNVGCNNNKKYSCSKTGIPLCSLECYRSNLAARGLS